MSAPDKIWAEMPEIFDDMGFWQEKPSAGFFEYVRLEPNTRAVTVDQLEQWSALICQLDIQDDHGWTIGDNSVVELRAIIGDVK
jgi:hypothetical protein